MKHKLVTAINIMNHLIYVNSVLAKNKFKVDKIQGEIIRNVHSIEKGLSIESPRFFFGLSKINLLMRLLEQYISFDDHLNDVIFMGIDAINAYLEFHSEYSCDSRYINVNSGLMKLKEKAKNLDHQDKKYGGTIDIKIENSINDYANLEQIINKRHSVRNFSVVEVPMEQLRKAIKLSLKAPSACNRQGVRAYIITGDNKKYICETLQGIGGFADSVDKYIIITGKLSSYRFEEIGNFQYAVSASIFAAYLTLTLQSLGIGACLIQRPLIKNKTWDYIRKKFDIPEDEQIVIMLGVGMPKKEYKVPISNRLEYNDMVREY